MSPSQSQERRTLIDYLIREHVIARYVCLGSGGSLTTKTAIPIIPHCFDISNHFFNFIFVGLTVWA